MQTITLQDTQAPEVPAEPRCLWPANKKWVCFDKASTTASFIHPTDACASSGLQITLTGCSVSDGQTSADSWKTDCKLTSLDRMCFLATRTAANAPRYAIFEDISPPPPRMYV